MRADPQNSKVLYIALPLANFLLILGFLPFARGVFLVHGNQSQVTMVVQAVPRARTEIVATEIVPLASTVIKPDKLVQIIVKIVLAVGTVIKPD